MCYGGIDNQYTRFSYSHLVSDAVCGILKILSRVTHVLGVETFMVCATRLEHAQDTASETAKEQFKKECHRALVAQVAVRGMSNIGLKIGM